MAPLIGLFFASYIFTLSPYITSSIIYLTAYLVLSSLNRRVAVILCDMLWVEKAPVRSTLTKGGQQQWASLMAKWRSLPARRGDWDANMHAFSPKMARASCWVISTARARNWRRANLSARATRERSVSISM